MKPGDAIGDFYVPEGETRHLRFVGDWFWYQGGTLVTIVVVHEMDAEDPLLLRQYGADQLALHLLEEQPDPDEWVRVHRFEGRGWGVDLAAPGEDPVQDASDAM